MKNYLVLLFLFAITIGSAQQSPEESVKKTVKDFFEAFHSRDSAQLVDKVSPGIRMQTIGKSAAGLDSVVTVPFERFVQSIVSIPDSVQFQERLLSISVRVDNNMAQAWTPYEFRINGSLSHCGVNSFQLFKAEEDWKILYIIDTRRKEGCEN
ncbi:nuclear transport factor 2 family protein [Muriicola soli]|uniref:Nuclear transport factor 2 family protein n=1 Tax=Muriicola soli TaxID=2507538 RepID=A0A411EA44_9FLAO|nr:nuclear transport factor 2 family protein [Muriicola soli]QBA64330.1 nuclear transport factor 2 family protein [Muriicola soli]